MSEGPQAPECYDVEVIVKLLRGQIAQEYDAYRMRERWPIVLAKTDPKVVAEALIRVLSHGQYVAREPRPVLANFTINCNGGDPQAIADAVAQCVGAVRL